MRGEQRCEEYGRRRIGWNEESFQAQNEAGRLRGVFKEVARNALGGLIGGGED